MTVRLALGVLLTAWLAAERLAAQPAPPPPAPQPTGAATDAPSAVTDGHSAQPIGQQAAKGAAEKSDTLVRELSSGRVAKFIERFTYLAIIAVLLLCGMGLPLPEEVPILTSGVLASTGHLRPWPALISVMIGVMLGDSMMFLLGRRWGSSVFEHRLSRKLLTRERQEKIAVYFGKYGAWIIFAARFLPGIRAPLFLSAGTMRVSFWTFFAMDGAAALLSIPISFWVAYVFTDKLNEMLHLSHRLMYWAVGGILLGSFATHFVWNRIKKARAAKRAEQGPAAEELVGTASSDGGQGETG